MYVKIVEERANAIQDVVKTANTQVIVVTEEKIEAEAVL